MYFIVIRSCSIEGCGLVSSLKKAGIGRSVAMGSWQLVWQGVNVVFSLKQQAPDDIGLVGSENGL